MTAREGRLGLRLAWGVACLGSGFAGCIVDESRCDTNQIKVASNGGLCECAANTVPSPRGYGCDACGEHEEVRGDKCECRPGYVRGASGACERSTTSTFLQPCSAADPCTEPFPYCANVGGSQFCTNTTCSKNADCPINYACRSEAEVRFCGPVIGLGSACTGAEGCAGTEAQYCETLQEYVCLPQGCASSAACPSGWSCCDLFRFVKTSLCVPTSYLDDGKCIDGSAPVTP